MTKLTAAQITRGKNLPARLINIGKEVEARVSKFHAYEAKASDMAVSISCLLKEAATFCDKGGFNAFRKRHCYAATDNIVLDVRMGPHIMGDDFVHQGPEKPTLSVRVHGTAPLARVEVIKDFVYVYSIEPKRASVEFNWTDYDPRPGMSWYYVRVLQSDGQLAWASPIWMRISQNR